MCMWAPHTPLLPGLTSRGSDGGRGQTRAAMSHPHLRVSLCQVGRRTPAPSFLGLQQSNSRQAPVSPELAFCSPSVAGRANKL